MAPSTKEQPTSLQALGGECLLWRRPSQQQQHGLISGCKHSIFFGNVCKECGRRMDSTLSNTLIPLDYVHQGLKLTPTEMTRLRRCEHANLLRDRKLCLVLDLDNTLLHSIPRVALSPKEKYLTGNKKESELHLFQWKFEGSRMLTKLRPYVRTFLEEVSVLFDLYVYTMGTRQYAVSMRQFIDPDRKFISDFKLISSENCTKKRRKSLDVVPIPETNVIILDDNKDSVWEENEENLIVVEPYHYFLEHRSGITSLAELHKDESENAGALAKALQRLKCVHDLFFNEGDPTSNDVRQTLQMVQHVNQGFAARFAAPRNPN